MREPYLDLVLHHSRVPLKWLNRPIRMHPLFFKWLNGVQVQEWTPQGTGCGATSLSQIIPSLSRNTREVVNGTAMPQKSVDGWKLLVPFINTN